MTTLASPERNARLLHQALLVMPVLFALVVIVLVTARPMPPLGSDAVQFALIGIAAALLLVGTTLGRRIEPRRRDQDAADYWRATLPKAVVVWGALEGAGLLAGIAGVLTGQVLIPLLGVVTYVALMVLYAPGRIEGR